MFTPGPLYFTIPGGLKRLQGGRGRRVRTWRLDIEYDGKRYGGWQRQERQRTVQGELMKAAETFLDQRVEVGGSGRTDAGVHALGQVAHLRVKEPVKNLTATRLRHGVNDLLPHDINVLRASHAPAHFHARRDAVARLYLYQISTRRTAFARPYVWWVKDRLDMSSMAGACAHVKGRHDFRSFCESPEAHGSTVVEVSEAMIRAEGDLILFRVGASHFLWKMVRRLVGTLVEVGRGRERPARVRQLLETHSREPARWTAPPSGLFLERVLYRGDAGPPAPAPAFPVGHAGDDGSGRGKRT